MEIAQQPGAPAHLVQTTHGYPNLLLAARLQNDSQQSIVSYRVGWAYVRPDGTEFHAGVLMSVPRAIKPGRIQQVSDQAVAFDAHSHDVIFFVAEVTLADGSRWNANDEEIAHEVSALNISR